MSVTVQRVEPHKVHEMLRNRPEQVPVVPLRGTVVYPLAIVSLEIGSEASMTLLEDAFEANTLVGLVAQRHAARHVQPDDAAGRDQSLPVEDVQSRILITLSSWAPGLPRPSRLLVVTHSEPSGAFWTVRSRPKSPVNQRRMVRLAGPPRRTE